MRSFVIAIVLAFAAVAGACDQDSQPKPESGGPASEAQVMYDTKCSRCHGIDGTAHGPSSDSLVPRPHNYADPVWQASVTDDQIKEIILRGGRNLHKNPAMPGNPTLKNRPEVLDGLVKIIRGFGKRP
jgi:mono/diheme cytochrome c family protein